MTDPIEPLIPLPFVFNTTQRITRDVSQTLTQFLNNLIYNSTTPLSFETYPEDIYTAPLIREHHDSYLYYIETHSLVLNSEEPPFSIPFTSLKNRSDTFRKNIYPNNIYIPIAKVFTTFLNHLQENNNLLTKHVFNPSSIQDLLQKESLFNLPNIEQFRTIENNPHHWLTTDILQIHHFQYQFFQNLTLNTKTKEQIQIHSLFLRKFFRHNYQLVWHSKFQDACINFPQQFSSDELLPFIINSDSQHKQYYNLLDFPSSHFQYLAYDPNSLNKSLNLPSPIRPYTQQSYLPPSTDTTSNISIQTLPSSSNALINPISLNNQHNPTSTSQVTLNNENLSPSNSPNQYNTPSNTPPAVPPNSVSLSTSFIPTLPPIPLSFNNTLPTQYFPPNPPISSISQTSSSTTQPTPYNPYVSLHPAFQNFPTNSHQPPPNPPQPPLSTSTIPFNSSSLQPSPPFPNTPSVPFAALSDPIKLFDGLDHTYPPEKFLAHLSARVTFQLGPQPTDIHSYLTWHSRRMSLLYCSLTGTASNWFDRLPQVYKDDWSSFLQIFKKQFYSQKHAYHAQIEALSLVKKDNENVRHFALKVETLVKQGWYNEFPSTINLKCNEIFTRGLPKKLKDFANKRQVKHVSSSLEPSIPFHSLVNMVDSEDITLEKIKTQELSLEINNLSTTFQQNTIIQDPPSEPPHVQVIDPNNKSKPQFKNIVPSAIKIITLFQLAFVALIYSKNPNHNLDLQLLPFINILKLLQINLVILDTVVEVIVIHLANPLATIATTIATILVLIHVHIHALDTTIKHPLVHIPLLIIVIDLDMTNITIKILNHILLHEHIITLILLVAHLNIIPVLVNVAPTLILLLLTDTPLLIVLLLNHAMIVIVADLIQIQITPPHLNINLP